MSSPTPPQDPLERLVHPPYLYDGGFTERVMARLPPSRARLRAGILCGAAALSAALALALLLGPAAGLARTALALIAGSSPAGDAVVTLVAFAVLAASAGLAAGADPSDLVPPRE